MLVINTRIFGRFWPVTWAINHHFGFLERFPPLMNPMVLLRPDHQHSQFVPILAVTWAINPRFGVPKRFSRSTIIGVELRAEHQHSQFWPILARFMGY